MRLKTIYDQIDAIAPFSLSKEYCEKYGAYDNSGILIDCGEEIGAVAFSLDCSEASVRYAKDTGANVLVTHHPAIYAPIKHIAEGALLQAIKGGISVISAHLNLDCAPDGIDESLMQGLGGSEPVLMHRLSEGGYGRAYAADTDTQALSERIRTGFGTDKLTVYGKERKLTKLASFCGAGMDEEAVAFALEQGAQAIVSSDGKHHVIASAVERGLNVFLLPHYTSENYGFYRFYQKIKENLTVRCEYFTDDRLL